MASSSASATIGKLFGAGTVDVEFNLLGVDIKLKARPQGFTGQIIAALDELQTMGGEEFLKHYREICMAVNTFIVSWNFAESGDDGEPLVYVPDDSMRRAQIVSLAKPVGEDGRKRGPGTIEVLDGPFDPKQGKQGGRYIDVPAAEDLKEVPLKKSVESLMAFPPEVVQTMMNKILEAGSPKATTPSS